MLEHALGYFWALKVRNKKGSVHLFVDLLRVITACLTFFRYIQTPQGAIAHR
jgi:hypothetical protein